MLDYFLTFEESFNRFPGFNYEVQGVYPGAGGRSHQVPYLCGARVAAAADMRRALWHEPKKKMNLMQLTFIVAVNMMGSGIIMLPTNMAQVGAISLLSWIVTAVGSMAIAYGFAQAGIFNQRTGGMAAYAEDAYGKAGYFQVFFLYFLSLAIGNVAIAISAVGYLATFFPWLSSTPIATCIGVIGLLVAHDGRQLRRTERDRQDRLHHGLGRHPAGRRCSRSSAGSGSAATRSQRRGIRRD